MPHDDPASAPTFISATEDSGELPVAPRAPQVLSEPAVSQSPPDSMVARANSAPRRVRRRVWLPVVLFFATCVSVFWAGAAREGDLLFIALPQAVAFIVANYWHEGLLYMLALMGILLAHEMGHFVFTLRHGVPASFPFFIPMPLNPIGTMGAVIAMQASRADRRQLFDIGIAGPIAGLLVALPVTCYAVINFDPQPAVRPPELVYHDPLLVKLLVWILRPELGDMGIYSDPLLKAGWVGMLITGLNMLPISQLDGGHISYALFGRRSRWLARGLMVAAIAFIILAQVYMWILMLVLLKLIGIDHPPTADDDVPLGWGRRLLGLASLSIPVLCFPPLGIS
jgi:Zn-dependent protease